MKKFDEENIVCTSDYGITVIIDEDYALKLSKKMHKGCIALKELSMGYGVFFTKDGIAGIYGPKENKELLDIFWDNNADQIEEDLIVPRLTKDVNAYVEVGATILVECSLAVIEAFEEYKQSVVA